MSESKTDKEGECVLMKDQMGEVAIKRRGPGVMNEGSMSGKEVDCGRDK